MKKSSLNEKRKELIKWAIIWAAGTFGSFIILVLFIISLIVRKIAPPSHIPWWTMTPVIIGIVLVIPLLKKAWQFDKLSAH